MSHPHPTTGRARPARSYGRQRPGGSSRPRNAGPSGKFALPTTITPALPPVDSFAALDMPSALKRTLTRQGLTTPSDIQAATLPNALAGRDVLGRNRTGSGKTLAYGREATWSWPLRGDLEVGRW